MKRFLSIYIIVFLFSVWFSPADSVLGAEASADKLTVTSPRFLNSADSVIYSLVSGTVKGRVSVENKTGAAKEPVLILALYNKVSGELISLKSASAAVDNNFTAVLSADINVSSASGCTLRAFVWDNWRERKATAVSQTFALYDTGDISPTAPNGITASATEPLSVTLSWEPSFDNIAVAGYEIKRNGVIIGTSINPTYTDGGLRPDTEYTYEICAYDQNSNKSAYTQFKTSTLAIPHIILGESSTGVLVSLGNSSGDGFGQNVVYQGRECRMIPAIASVYYSYYQVDGKYITRNDRNVEIRVTYYDSAATGAPTIQYNAVGNNFKPAAVSSVSTGADRWKTAQFVVSDADFQKGANGSDFRIAGLKDKPIYISKIAVTKGHIESDIPDSPVNVIGSNLTHTGLTLSWENVQTNVNVFEIWSYDIYRNNVKIANVPTTNYTDSGLLPGTEYKYEIVAVDELNKQSAKSAAVDISTASFDTYVPQGLRAESVGLSSVKLTWASSAGLKYEIYRDGALVYTTAFGASSYTDAALASGASYVYKIVALNSENISSLPSADLEVTTVSLSTYAPENLAAQTTLSGILTTWNKVDGLTYDIYRDGAKINSAPVTDGNYWDSGLTSETIYEYKVVGINGATESLPSTISAKTLKGVVLDNCDSAAGWILPGGLTATLDALDKKVGTGSLALKSLATADRLLRPQKTFAPAVNTGVSEENGALQFWLYITEEDRNRVVTTGDSQIEICSGAVADINEYHWHAGTVLSGSKAGWNLITLKFSDASKQGNLNLSAIDWFRIYAFTVDQTSITIKLDEITIVELP